MPHYHELREIVFNVNQIELWVCDFKQKTILNMPLRNLKPTKVLVKVNEEYREIVRENVKSGSAQPYSDSSLWGKDPFKIYPYNSKGEIKKTKINFFGNHSGDDGLHFFYKEDDCIQKYNDLVYSCLEAGLTEKKNTINKLDEAVNELKNRFIKTDYIMEKLSREN